MIKKVIPFFILAVIALFSCEPNNPYNIGPVYDAEGNLAIDRVKIDAYLDTAKIDSLYRIHDPSGVVIIVQEEGEGSRPKPYTIVYTDYIGKLIEDGTVFDTSIEQVAKDNAIYDENRNYSIYQFVLDLSGSSGGEIVGWNYAFSRLRPGSKAVLIIPSRWGFRNLETVTRVPPNSVLRFDVDFLGMD